MSTLTYNGALVVRTCWCGIRHAIPSELATTAEENKGQVVYCPLGHEWVASVHEQREADRLRGLLQNERQRLSATRDLLKHEERSHAATRGHLTRAKKRAHAGVCPVQGCKRHFKDLERHMASKHPGFARDREPGGEA